jgi:hypothetical protein
VGVVADALHTPGVTSAAEARLDDAGLIAVQGATLLDARTGVMWGPGSTALVTDTADTAPMAYLVAPHHWITGRGVNTDGVYRGALETATRVPTGAAPASGSRIDVIYDKQGDANSTITPDGSTAPIYGVVQGNPTTGTPVKPSIPVGALELATATVSAGATATNGAGVVISNTARQTVARGGRIAVRTQAERDALAAFPGLEVYRLDNGQVQLCTGISPTTWATIYDPATSTFGIGVLADVTGADGTATTSGTALQTTVTIPAGLSAARRIKVTGTVWVSAGTGVGLRVAVGGTTRTINTGGQSIDMTVVDMVTDLTPGSRTFSIVVLVTVSGQVVTYRSPQLLVEIV